MTVLSNVPGIQQGLIACWWEDLSIRSSEMCDCVVTRGDLLTVPIAPDSRCSSVECHFSSCRNGGRVENSLFTV